MAAPFIGAGPLEDLVAALDPDSPPRIHLIANLDRDSLLRGTVDAEAIAGFCRSLPSATVTHLPGLHAKAYVADERLAIITSGNMTRESLHRNYEYGALITEPEAVRQIAADMREYGFWGRRCLSPSWTNLRKSPEGSG